jgi:hypothetical protein
LDPLFRSGDIGIVLGFNDINSTIRDFDETEKGMHTTHTLAENKKLLF